MQEMAENDPETFYQMMDGMTEEQLIIFISE